jgi:hypothetical protein
MMPHDCASDDFRDLRDNAVSERPDPVHPSGYPMNHSHQAGFNRPPSVQGSVLPIVIASRRARNSGEQLSLLKSLAVRVGNNPDALPEMRRSNIGSRYAMPFRIIPERGQVSENTVEPSIKQCCDVLHDDELRSYLANNSSVLRPKSAANSFNSSALARNADVLTGEAAADDIHGNSVCPETIGCEGSDISENRDSWPVLSQHSLAVGIDLAEGDGSHPGSFEPEAEAANSAEEIKHIHVRLQ